MAQTPDRAPEPAPIESSITVVEKITAETPASLSVLERRAIRQTPGVNLDDRLRIVPGFTLFRRTSSLTAHPTTQGVSLRGIGSTGASRTLVLWDGLPVNDPFGGWVYWTRFAPDELERVEISRGASTSVFGDRAMGGAIALFSRPAERYRVFGSYEGGNRRTHSVSAKASHVWPRLAISTQGRAFTTDGYYLVPQAIRGPVDTKAGVRFVAGDTRLDWQSAKDRLFVKLDALAEDRRNGSPLQTNSTSLGQLSANYSRQLREDSLSLLAWHYRAEFRSGFSAIAASRRTETPTFYQRVPAEATGGAGFWNHRGGRWNALIGFDSQRAEGTSIDRLFPSGIRQGGGVLWQNGLFGQFDVKAGPARVFLGTRQHFAGPERRFFSPSAGMAAGRSRWRVRGSVYRGFRVPTLNELYREFRAGNAITQANADLGPETMTGVEAGMDFVGESTRGAVTLYRNALDNLITNVTLRITGNQIVRQRQNFGSAVARGVEAQISHRWRHLTGELSYLLADSRFATGERLPQTPRHQGVMQVAYARGGTLLSVALRAYDFQFEDDRNFFILPGFAVLQATASQRLAGDLWAILALENALDREFLAGFSPTPLVGAPRLVRVGLRWEGRLRR